MLSQINRENNDNNNREQLEEKRAAVAHRVTVHEHVPLSKYGGSMTSNEGTKRLLEDVGSEKMIAMVTRFYEHAFEDKHIDKFIRSHSDPHGERLAYWIMEKMNQENPVWSMQRPPNARTKAHRDAWTCPKREPERVGARFKLDDCRIWMRLMFWSAREEGLDAHEQFFSWFVRFISHFIAVYEFSAPPYAKESAEWSLNPDNISQYRENGYLMKDVVGIGRY